MLWSCGSHAWIVLFTVNAFYVAIIYCYYNYVARKEFFFTIAGSKKYSIITGTIIVIAGTIIADSTDTILCSYV